MTVVFCIGATRKKRKAMNRFMKRVLKQERKIPFDVKLRGETAQNNWRKLHGLKPQRRVQE